MTDPAESPSTGAAAPSHEAESSRLEVGHIAKAHGLRGDVVVRLTTDRTDERTEPGSVLFADGRELVIGKAKPYQKGWLFTFDGVNSKEAADALRGAALTAEPLDIDDAVFVHELIGKHVVDQHGVDHGEIVSLIDNPAADLIELADGQLVPMNFYVSGDATRVLVDVPLGLLGDD